MKKLLLLFVVASVGLAASAQFKSQPSVNPQTNSKTKMVNLPQSKRSFQAVAPRTDLAKNNMSVYNVARKNGWLDDYTWFSRR